MLFPFAQTAFREEEDSHEQQVIKKTNSHFFDPYTTMFYTQLCFCSRYGIENQNDN